MTRGPAPDPAGDARFWLAVHAFRIAALVYAVILLAFAADSYRHPYLGWAVLAILACWTTFVVLRVGVRPVPEAALPGGPGRDPDAVAAGGGARATRLGPILVADLVIAAAAVLSTRFLDDPARIAAGAQTLPSIWPAAAVLSWAVWRGWRGGLIAAGVIAVADLLEVGTPTLQTVNNIVLLVLVGAIVGIGVELIRAGRAEMAAAVAVRAAAQERERLARDIHDSVLQVLGYVSRRGGHLDGDAAELARLAGEQEARLRALVSTGPAPPASARRSTAGPAVGRGAPGRDDSGEEPADLRESLSRLAGPAVTVSGPAGPVMLPGAVVRAFVGATGAAVDNVRRHAGPGAGTWILLDDEGSAVSVTIRDDGVGLAPDRLQAAVVEGRLGVSSSIVGRMESVGGRARVTGEPGNGTEVQLRFARVPVEPATTRGAGRRPR